MAPWRTLITAVHPHPSVKINHGATFMVTDRYGAIPVGSEGEFGLYSSDTRYLSRHELRINGRRPDSVASVRLSYRHARWHMIADNIAGPGGDMREARVAVTIDRLINLHQMHEDVSLHTYARGPVTVLLEIALESDFADLFEVRYRSWQRRADLNTWWRGPNCLESRYQNGDFVRRCVIRILKEEAGVTYANGALRIPVDLEPGKEWSMCLQYDLLTSDDQAPDLAGRCAFDPEEPDPMRQARSWQLSVSQVEPSDLRLQFAYRRAVEDLAALRLHEQETMSERWMPAAGLPWFMALFGRDSLIASLQAMVVQPTAAIGTLENLARWQSEGDDPERDAEPGKIPHELRVGEWRKSRDAGVEKENVETSVLARDGLEELRDFALVGGVGFDDFDRSVELLARGFERFGISSGDDDLCAFFGEAFCGGESDSGGAAGDECDFVFQSLSHFAISV